MPPGTEVNLQPNYQSVCFHDRNLELVFMQWLKYLMYKICVSVDIEYVSVDIWHVSVDVAQLKHKLDIALRLC